MHQCVPLTCMPVGLDADWGGRVACQRHALLHLTHLHPVFTKARMVHEQGRAHLCSPTNISLHGLQRTACALTKHGSSRRVACMHPGIVWEISIAQPWQQPHLSGRRNLLPSKGSALLDRPKKPTGADATDAALATLMASCATLQSDRLWWSRVVWLPGTISSQ